MELTMFWFNAVLILYVYLCLVFISFSDIEDLKIPDVWTAALAAAGVLANAACAADNAALLSCFSAALLPPALFAAVAFICAVLGKAMPFGFGDAKLLSAMAIAGGASALAFTFVSASLAAGIYSAVMLIAGKKHKRDRIAFGPFASFFFMLYWVCTMP